MRETVMLSEGGRCRMKNKRDRQTEPPDLCLSVCNGVMMHAATFKCWLVDLYMHLYSYVYTKKKVEQQYREVG